MADQQQTKKEVDGVARPPVLDQTPPPQTQKHHLLLDQQIAELQQQVRDLQENVVLQQRVHQLELQVQHHQSELAQLKQQQEGSNGGREDLENEEEEEEEVYDDDVVLVRLTGTMRSACLEGDVALIIQLLNAGESVHAEDGFKNPAISFTLLGGQLEASQALYERGARLSFIDWFGRNALHMAARGGDIACIDWLFANGSFDVNAITSDGWTPVLKAVVSYKFAAAVHLVEMGANMFIANDSGERAIDWALGQTVLQHAKDLVWESVKPLLLLSKASSSTVLLSSKPSATPPLPSLSAALAHAGIVRCISSFLLRNDLIIKDPAITRMEKELEAMMKKSVEVSLTTNSKRSNKREWSKS
jgi:hypothetical protein